MSMYNHQRHTIIIDEMWWFTVYKYCYKHMVSDPHSYKQVRPSRPWLGSMAVWSFIPTMKKMPC